MTFAQCPLLYVHGNHDQKYEKTPPEGCICIEDKIYVHEGIRILGLGGSMCYTGGAHQYTEAQMAKRVRHLRWQLLRHHGFDVLLTHSPASGLGDLPDLPHRGFEVFHRLLEKYEPKWMVHGHVHTNYGRGIQRICTSGRTMIVNASERYMLEYEEIPEEIS